MGQSSVSSRPSSWRNQSERSTSWSLEVEQRKSIETQGRPTNSLHASFYWEKLEGDVSGDQLSLLCQNDISCEERYGGYNFDLKSNLKSKLKPTIKLTPACLYLSRVVERGVGHIARFFGCHYRQMASRRTVAIRNTVAHRRQAAARANKSSSFSKSGLYYLNGLLLLEFTQPTGKAVHACINK